MFEGIFAWSVLHAVRRAMQGKRIWLSAHCWGCAPAMAKQQGTASPQRKFVKTTKVPKMKAVVVGKSYVSPSEADDFRGTPLVCPYVTMHIFAHETHKKHRTAYTGGNRCGLRNMCAYSCLLFPRNKNSEPLCFSTWWPSMGNRYLKSILAK